jgi:exodeoxyribonuclease-5
MLTDHLISQFVNSLQYPPTEGQHKLFKTLAEFVTDNLNSDILVVNGYAGTGKTSAIGSVVKVLDVYKQKVVLLAPTGRAAKVFAHYSNKPAYTVHKQIYRQKVAADVQSVFQLDRNLNTDTLFIVDEASMISNTVADQSIFGTGNLLRDLVEYVRGGKNCKLILVGDDAQLPPIGLEQSPALDLEVMRIYGKIFNVRLTEVVRQGVDSGILKNATIIRCQLEQPDLQLPSLVIDGFDDVTPISGMDLLELLETSFYKYGSDQVVVVTKSNKRANVYNNGIRQRILYRDEELSVGDSIMVVKNNYFWTSDVEELSFIANGDIAVIERIRKYEERYGFRFANVTLRFPDYGDLSLDVKIVMDTLASESASLTYDQSKTLYSGVAEDFAHLRLKKERWLAVKNDPFYNALQVKFAYAITCHKAQGGQWPVVFIDHGYFKEEMLSVDFLRWLYTAITRASSKVYLVNFDKKFFQ